MARVAIVTGGTRGIGCAIAVALRDAGCKVVASYASDDAKERFVRHFVAAWNKVMNLDRYDILARARERAASA